LLRRRDGLAQHVEVADVVGEDEHEPGIERRRLSLG
jgi:hypothetical protein